VVNLNSSCADCHTTLELHVRAQTVSIRVESARRQILFQTKQGVTQVSLPKYKEIPHNQLDPWIPVVARAFRGSPEQSDDAAILRKDRIGNFNAAADTLKA